MSNEFNKRLAAVRDRVTAEKQRASDQEAADREVAEQKAGLERSAADEWEKRILPLINQVVDAANKQLAGSGTRLLVATEFVRVTRGGPAGLPAGYPFAEIFGSPEGTPGATRRTVNTPHVRVGVESGGEIKIAVEHPHVASPGIRMLPDAVQQQQIEDAVANLVEAIL
jgi:hypothetical protein